ncbi:MAG: hypothetical protein U5L10_05550 [Candidatus Moranbacteria bacterium]|nr:hypothetical protein [Candidatus Moranbacteria bacterium]
MKIKKNYYCIVDENNKPDFRFLFESEEDARKKINKIKNSTRGQTILLGKNKKDFFVDGIRKDFVNPNKKLHIKRGCWSKLRIKKLSLLENVSPENFFELVVKSKENKFAYEKQEARELNVSVKKPDLRFPDYWKNFFDVKNFSWENSFLRSKGFAFGVMLMFFLTASSVLMIQKNASEEVAYKIAKAQSEAIKKTAQVKQAKVLGEAEENNAAEKEAELNNFVLNTLKRFEEVKQEELEGEINKMVAGTPMEKMTPYIAQKDRRVAAFIVAIAKKESNWGKRVPVLNGQDCYNYWGYRGIRERMGTGGHTCFDSRKDAVDTVAGRLKDLVEADIDTPEEMVIWKCGSTCEGHSDYSVRKWINDVEMYFEKLEDNKNKA